MPKKKEKISTFNDLDIRFQVNEEHPDDYVFEEEKQLIDILKKRNAKFAQLSDEVLLHFLFSRRHELDEVEKVLENFFDLLEKYQISDPSQIPRENVVKSISCHPESNERPFYYVRYGAYDNHHRNVEYMISANNYASHRQREHGEACDMFFAVFNAIERSKHVPMKYARNGTIIVADLRNASTSNIDTSSSGRDIRKSMQDSFPTRYRQIYLVNPPALVRILFAVLKQFLPKKLMERLKVIKEEELAELIPPNSLLSIFQGGKLEFNPLNNFLPVKHETEK